MSQRLDPKNRTTCKRQMVSLTQKQNKFVLRLAKNQHASFSQIMRGLVQVAMDEDGEVDMLLELLAE